jgi:hypothetical protein
MKIAKFEHRSQGRTDLKQKNQIFPGQQWAKPKRLIDYGL